MKRIATKLLTSATIGAIASVASAWIAIILPHTYRQTSAPPSAWFISTSPPGSAAPTDAHIDSSLAVQIINLLELDPNRKLLRAQFMTRSGWPFLCMESGVFMSTTPPVWSAMPGSRAGIELPRAISVRLGSSSSITLPTHPYVPGLLANIVIYGSVAFAALIGVDRLRSARRRRLGRCWQCGHSLDAFVTVCPECGTARNTA